MNAALTLEPNGEFLARPDTVGTTTEELTAVARGEVSKERVEVIARNLRFAAFSLGAETQGRC